MKESKKKYNRKIIFIVSLVVIFLLFIGVGLCKFLFFPKIEIVGKTIETVSLNDSYKEQGATINGSSKDIEIIGEVDTSKVGSYKIVYKTKKFGLTFTKTREVKVVDKEAPVISLKGEKKIILCPGEEFKDYGYTVSDNYDKDLDSKVEVIKSNDSVVYKVKDSSGNESEEKRELVFEDKNKPSIKLKGSNLVYLTVNSKYKEAGFVVSDNCDKDLEKKVKVTNNINTKKVGEYKVEYKVTDSSGNSVKVDRKVYVKEDVSNNNVISNNTSSERGIIYLTFDDGPSSSITPKLLDILKKKNVKATFFVINHGTGLDYLIKREYNEGHTVALHSYTHNYGQIYSSVNNYFNDLNKISNKVFNITGQKSMFIRFPGGSSNTVSRNYSKGIMTKLTKQVVDKGYKYFDWNVGSGDSGEVSTKEAVYRNVINGLSKKRINMVLMHDFENNYKTLNALSDIIDYGLKNNYEFRAINSSTPMVTHGVNN